MDHQYIEDRDVVGRYLQRALDLDEHARFEEHFADCPECLDRLALAEMFRESQRNHAAGATAPRPPAASGWMAKLGRLPRGQQRFIVFLAALTLAGAPSAFFFGRSFGITRQIENGRTRGEHAPGDSGWQSTSIRILHPRRTGDPANEIVLERTTAPLALMLPDYTAASGGSPYRLTLRKADGVTVWAEAGISIAPGASVGLLVPAGALTAGTYTLFLDALTSDRGYSPIAEYLLHIAGADKH